MKIIFFTFILKLTINYVHNFALPNEGLYQLNLIHYNDFHARFEETSLETPICHSNDSNCFGGFARLAYAIKELKREKPISLLLNAGDSFQGTSWYTLLKWNITQEFMNLLPHDAHAIGNHDFDDGPEGLAPYLKSLNAPAIAANMDSSDEPSLEGLYTPYIIIEKMGRKIGIIGVTTTTTEILAPVGKVVFTDPFEAAALEAKNLYEMGIDVIILLSHCGYDVDMQIAREYGEHIDIIVGGHSHRDERFSIPYFTKVRTLGDSKHEVVIVQASAFTKILGNLTVYFDYLGNIVKWEGGPIVLNRSVPEDEETKEKLAPYAKLVHESETKSIGFNMVTLRHKDCAYGECGLGDLLTDAINAYVKSTVKTEYDCISLLQRSNIRTSLLKGSINQGSLIELFPYRDFLETFEIKGKYVLDALEMSVSDATSPFDAPWLLQVSGLRVLYNVSQPEGQRVVSVYIGDGASRSTLDLEKYYQITAPAYLANGGDGYEVLPTQRRNLRVLDSDQDALLLYIKQHTPLHIVPDGRITITH
ncbi:apyrase-like [Epargyreus clarus]|uniref:apyrase-like n=1 Tax=Epargyreus clarus TaxID=520877 RepID=UPI003C2C4168